MNEKLVEKNEEIEIDLQRVLSAIWQKIWLILLVAVLCAGLTLAGTMTLITPLYKSSAMFYVNNNSVSVGDTSFSLSSGDLVTSRNLVKSYIVILNTRESLNDVIDYAGVDRSYSEVRGMISADAVNETEIFQVVVTSPDPQEAEKIANAIAYILPKRISSIIEGTSAKIVDAAVVPSSPSSPSYTKNTLIGFAFGLLLMAGIIALREIFDVTITTEEDITQSCAQPVLAAVPDMAAPSKGGYYYYGYGNNRQRRRSEKNGLADHGKQPTLIGNDISFAAAEAYKLLRTKLQFSFADENQCHVIGVSSALSGEGKSLSSVNLAFTLSQLNKRVILIDGDMRRPSLADKLPIEKSPGLSDYLTGQSHLDTLIQKCGISGDAEAFDTVASGRNPPNPVELLSSARMVRLLGRLKEHYDYVILDLPPVGEVTDALAVAKLTDGMLLVVRQNYCNRVALKETAQQFEFIESRILGVVYNCADEHSTGYGKKYKYGKRYYKKYYSKYAGSYRAAAKAERNASANSGGNGKGRGVSR